MPEAIVAFGQGKRAVGQLRFESDGRRQHRNSSMRTSGWPRPFFELTPGDARREAFQMAETIAKNWKRAVCDEGGSSDALRTYADAFEHTESEKALRLDD